MGLDRTRRMAEAIPDYPGREQAEKVARVIVESIGGPLIRHASTAIVLRTLGYALIWHALKEAGYQNPRAEMIDRRWLGRTWAWEVEKDIKIAYGVEVQDLKVTDLAEVARVLGIVPPSGEASTSAPERTEGDEVAPAAPERRRRTPKAG